ncbi:efflux RND transporter permease subunit [Paenibacillus sp. L3-i20]|uniref:efflux RND transporter permease subunit n=1 Tax=Paenibacillus sp. L3-i20 TaxID=2905833 RepID=UPI001EDDCB36|nr:efflux RND transporter permease subunit [Paenibacillus sp. L3-i20]GKU77376.1 swarming motility protein SwrC [Paenibacillus sp. L3-i20]
MKALIDFSMNKIAAMIILIAILFGAGAYSGMSLKVENMPNISVPYLMITTPYQASPQDVMGLVTKPIEDKIANVQGLTMLSSTSSDGMSMVTLEFNEKVNMDKMKQDLESLVQEVSLPKGAGRSKISSLGFASTPAYYLAVYAKESMSQSELDQLYERQLKPSFEAINGIDHIDTIGARKTSLDIQLDASALLAYGLTPSAVNELVQSALSKGSVGVVKFNGNTGIVRVQGELNSLFSLENLEIAAPTGQTLLLKDLANIQAVNEVNFIARMDGKHAIGIHLYKSAATNAVEFSDETNKLIHNWEKEFSDVSFNKLYDSADEVRGSISGLLKEGFIGIVLASLMILIFLRNVRMTIIVIVSIPLSILLTLIMMHTMNITLNIMSLGGMFIAVGRIVDDSIVVIESIYANLQKAQQRNESVILLAVKQVAMAISSSTFVTVGVFLPIAFVSGMVGGLFRPFAVTVSCALLASLLVSLTVIPMMAKLMVLRSSKATDVQEHAGGKFESLYERVLIWSLTHRIKTLLFSGLLLILTIMFTVPNLPKALMPEGVVNKQMNFAIMLPSETPFDSTDMQSKVIEKLLRDAKDESDKPLFTFVEALVGYYEDDERVTNSIEIITEVNENADPKLVKDQYTQLIAAQLPKGSEVLPGSFAGGSGYSTTDFTYVIYGEDQQVLEQASTVIKSKMKESPELKEIKDSLGDAKKEMQVTINSSKARSFGLSNEHISALVGGWIAKYELGNIRLDNTVYRAGIELAPRDKSSLEQLGQMPIQAEGGAIVYLNEVAKLEEVKAPVSLDRESQKLMVRMTAKIDVADKAAVAARVTAELGQIELPTGVTTTTRGVSTDMMKSFNQMYVAMGAAIAIVYLIMVLCFGNAGTPFAILFSLPLAVIGGLLGLWVTNESINITSLIGFLMLIGIVVTNAIVLLDRTQQLRKEGYLVRHAIIESGKVRLRPIIMTAGATISAMVPLALGLSHGTLISKGLAVVVIGGLITSTILTLVVVPIIYEMIESFKERMSRMFKKSEPATGVKDINV